MQHPFMNVKLGMQAVSEVLQLSQCGLLHPRARGGVNHGAA
jgi:hypothetical protein